MFGGHSSPSSALKASTASSALVAFTPSPTAINTSSASALPLAQLTRAPSNAYSSTWTFTQGFLLGQASFLILCGVFIRYVVFEDAEKSRARRLEREKKAVMSTTNVPPPSSNELLDKAGYDMSTHPSETSDWINVLFAQVLQGYRDDMLGAGGEEGARKQVEKWLNPQGKSLSWLDPITVTSLSLGKAYPLLSNARIRPADGQGRLRAEVDIDYNDSIHLSIATSLLINFPRPRFAVLPVALGIELVGIGGTMTMQIHHANDMPTSVAPDARRQHMHVSLLPDFHLNVKATSLLGSRAKLQDIPKLEQIVISRLRAGIQDKLVWPRYVGFGLPRLVSRGVESTNQEQPLTNEPMPMTEKRPQFDAAPELRVLDPPAAPLANNAEGPIPGGLSDPKSPPFATPHETFQMIPETPSRSHSATSQDHRAFAASLSLNPATEQLRYRGAPSSHVQDQRSSASLSASGLDASGARIRRLGVLNADRNAVVTSS